MTFTKDFFEYYESQELGHFYNCRLYTLYENQKIEGTFLISSDMAFISTQNTKVKITIKNNIFKPSDYSITDIKSKDKIGFYRFLNWDIGLKKNAILTLDNKEYNCHRLNSDIKYKIFTKSTWGHYKISLSGEETEILYTLKVQENWFNLKSTEFRPAEGEVKSNHLNKHIILYGFLFIERMLNSIDYNA